MIEAILLFLLVLGLVVRTGRKRVVFEVIKAYPEHGYEIRRNFNRYGEVRSYSKHVTDESKFEDWLKGQQNQILKDLADGGLGPQ